MLSPPLPPQPPAAAPPHACDELCVWLLCLLQRRGRRRRRRRRVPTPLRSTKAAAAPKPAPAQRRRRGPAWVVGVRNTKCTAGRVLMLEGGALILWGQRMQLFAGAVLLTSSSAWCAGAMLQRTHSAIHHPQRPCLRPFLAGFLKSEGITGVDRPSPSTSVLAWCHCA